MIWSVWNSIYDVLELYDKALLYEVPTSRTRNQIEQDLAFHLPLFISRSLSAHGFGKDPSSNYYNNHSPPPFAPLRSSFF